MCIRDSSQPIHPAPGRAARSRAISRDLGRSRGRAALSRRSRAISGDLGAAPRYLGRSRSVARAAAHLLKRGRTWLEPRGSRGRARSVLAASPCATWAGEAAPRAARPSPRHADPCAHRSSSALSGLLLRSRRGTRRYSLPPTSDGLGRFCAPLAPVHVPRARLPGLMPRPNQQHARLMPGPNPLPGWCQGSMNLLSVSFPPPPRQD